jgi:chemotaxis protein MotA
MNIILTCIFVGALAMFGTTVFRSIGLSTLFNPDALMIVVGGTIIATFIGFPISRLKKTFVDVLDAFRPLTDRQELAKEMLELARSSRRADIHGLEKKIRSIKDTFLRLGMNLLITNRPSYEIRSAMEQEMAMRVMDSQLSQNVLKAVARLTPSFGLAGTVICLIKIFNASQSIDDIAPLMAVAMMSTFYGVVISNLFMLPLCAKLEERSVQAEAQMHGILEGIVGMNELQNPLHVEERVSGNYEGDMPVYVAADSGLASARLRQSMHAA